MLKSSIPMLWREKMDIAFLTKGKTLITLKNKLKTCNIQNF